MILLRYTLKLRSFIIQCRERNIIRTEHNQINTNSPKTPKHLLTSLISGYSNPAQLAVAAAISQLQSPTIPCPCWGGGEPLVLIYGLCVPIGGDTAQWVGSGLEICVAGWSVIGWTPGSISLFRTAAMAPPLRWDWLPLKIPARYLAMMTRLRCLL